MGKRIKMLLLSCVLILCICCFINLGLASSSGITMEKDGFEATFTTDKEYYSKDDDIIVGVEVINHDDNHIRYINVEFLMPEFLELKEGQDFGGEVFIGQGSSLYYTGTFTRMETDDDIEDVNPDIPQTSDNNYNVFGFIMLAILILAVACLLIMFIKNKKTIKLMSIILCIIFLSTMYPLSVSNAQSRVVKEGSFTIEKTVYIENEPHTVAVEIRYDDKERMSQEELEQARREMWERGFDSYYAQFKVGQVSTDLSDWPYSLYCPEIIEATVDYELKIGTGGVLIQPNLESPVRGTAGGIGTPIEIYLTGPEDEEIEKAKISFKYDRDKLYELNQDINENDLSIAWYDRNQGRMVLLENSVVDTSNCTVSVETTHFSEYIVVDSKEWYEAWSRTQLIIREDNTDFNIAFALDSSGSMSGNKLDISKEVTYNFIEQLLDNDMVSVLKFADSASIVVQPTLKSNINNEELLNLINSINAGGGTNIERALELCYDVLNQMIGLRPIIEGQPIPINPSLIVLLSDGQSSVSESILEKLRNSDCRVISVALGHDADEQLMQHIAYETNGRYVFAENADSLIEIFEQLRGELVGLTEDSDGDGIPDLIETTGMRDQFGEINTSDPNNPDTDGDGYTDGEEMGEFITSENGEAYFRIKSHPTIPSNYLSFAKVDFLSFSARNIRELNTTSLCNNFDASAKFKVFDIVTTKDFLTEDIYDTPVNLGYTVEMPNCIIIDYYSSNLTDNVNEYLVSLRGSCINGGIGCRNNHKLKITLNADNAESITTECNIDFESFWRETIKSDINEYKKLLAQKGEAIGNAYINQRYIKDIEEKSDIEYLEQNILIGGYGSYGDNKLKNAVKKLLAEKFAGHIDPLKPITNASMLIKEVLNYLEMGSENLTLRVGGVIYQVTVTTLLKNKSWIIDCKRNGLTEGYFYAMTQDLEDCISEFLISSKQLLELYIEETKEAIIDGIISESINDLVKPAVFELIKNSKAGKILENQNPGLFNDIKNVSMIIDLINTALEMAEDDNYHLNDIIDYMNQLIEFYNEAEI